MILVGSGSSTPVKSSVEFRLVWHRDVSDPSLFWVMMLRVSTKAVNTETLSASAPMGKFRIFHDLFLVEHLGIRESQSVQHFDSPHARWVTILKNSPALKIIADSTHHFKLCAVESSLENVVKSSPASLPSSSRDTPHYMKVSPVKVESSAGEDVFGKGGVDGSMKLSLNVIDLSSSVDEEEVRPLSLSPSPKKRRSPSVPYISLNSKSAPPEALSDFPPIYALPMDIRMRWILDNDELGSLPKRFSSVFSCTYKPSTFHKHWASWRWLRENGELCMLDQTCLWKTLTDKVPSNKEERRSVADNSSDSKPFGEVFHVD